MQLRTGRTFLGLAAVAVACLIGSVTVAGQTAPAQNGSGVILTDQAFKSVAILRGIPVDTFFDAMGMFANAMGNDCTYCHDSKSALDRAAFALPTPRIQRARQMIVMMNTINKQFFNGQPRVTCFTCHAGNQSPRSDPNLALQYSTPVEDPNVRDFATDPTVQPAQILDKYIAASGGADRLARFTSFAAKGTYSGFDTLFEALPVEIFGKAPNQYATIVHRKDGNSVRPFDGTTAWMAGPDTPVPLLTLSAGNLDRARLEAITSFPLGLRQAFSNWRVGRAVLNDQEMMVLQAQENGQGIANFYFNESGLLARFVRWTLTPVGWVPTQVDYDDYRDVAGVKFPFKRKVSQTYMMMEVVLTDVQANTPVDASRFARPAPRGGA